MSEPLTREQVEENLDALRAQAQRSPTSLAAQAALINGLEFEYAALRARLEQAERENVKLVNDITKWQDIASLRLAGDVKFCREHEGLKVQLAAAQARVRELEQENEALKGHNHIAEAEILRLTARLARVEAALKQTFLARLTDELERMADEA